MQGVDLCNDHILGTRGPCPLRRTRNRQNLPSLGWAKASLNQKCVEEDQRLSCRTTGGSLRESREALGLQLMNDHFLFEFLRCFHYFPQVSVMFKM
jgi:hypothetical protein